MENLRERARGASAEVTKQAWRQGKRLLPAKLREPTRLVVRKALRATGMMPPPEPADVPQTKAPVAPGPRPPTVEPVAPDPATMVDPAECPVCGAVVDGFSPFGMVRVQPDRRCPECGSLERHRLVWLYFQRKTHLFSEPVQMLHIAPEAFLEERFRAMENIDYLSADIALPHVMVKMDITDIQYPDDSFDIIFASHVLEHIPDDVQAMRELRRVLRPTGWAVLQVPMWGPKTKEDPAVTDPEERAKLFGQDDHVRMYGHDGEYHRRLLEAGFEVEVDQYVTELGPDLAHRYRLMEEDIYLCRKR